MKSMSEVLMLVLERMNLIGLELMVVVAWMLKGVVKEMKGARTRAVYLMARRKNCRRRA